MLKHRIGRVLLVTGLAGALLGVTLAGAAPSASPPVGDWKMDERERDGPASIPRRPGTTGRFVGRTRHGSTGQHGLGAARCDGPGHARLSATVPDSASLDISAAITMAAWVKPREAATHEPDQESSSPSGHNRSTATSSRPSSARLHLTKVFVRFNQVTSGDALRINSTTSYPSTGTHLDARGGHL